MSEITRRIKLDKQTRKGLEFMAKHCNVTIDEAALIAVLAMLRKYDSEAYAEIRERIDPRLVQLIEKA